MSNFESKSITISIIGRPNVGKSTIFNRLLGRGEQAITHDRPGVTRDRHYAISTLDELADHDPSDIILVDTGGFYPEQIDESSNLSGQERRDNHFFNIMTDHAKLAIEQSHLVLLVVDVREGLIPFDHSIARFLREGQKPFWLLINKFDTEKQRGDESEFYALGVDDEQIFTTSAAHNRGIDNIKRRMQQFVVNHNSNMELPDSNENLPKHLQWTRGLTANEQVVSKLAIIGAPNAGKSTLLNRLLGVDRALISNIPGTTIDPIEGYFDLYFGPELIEELDQKEEWDWGPKQEAEGRKRAGSEVNKQERELDREQDRELEQSIPPTHKVNRPYWRSLQVVDTAGIRKQSSVKDVVESQSVYRALHSINESDIVIFMVDAAKGISHQDRRLLDIAHQKGKSLIIALNKYDLVRGDLKSKLDRKKWMEDYQDTLPWLTYCDLIPISAKEGGGIGNLKRSIKKTVLIRKRKVPTGELNRYLMKLVDKNPVVVKRSGGKRFQLKYASMVKSNPPTFMLFANRNQGIPENFKRYIKNGLRQEFSLDNTPIHLLFK